MTNTTALPAAPAGATTVTPSTSLSVAALVLGISSVLFGFTFVVPIAAIIVGVVALRREPAGHVLAVWGIALGGVMSFGWVIAAFVGVLFAGPFFLAWLF